MAYDFFWDIEHDTEEFILRFFDSARETGVVLNEAGEEIFRCRPDLYNTGKVATTLCKMLPIGGYTESAISDAIGIQHAIATDGMDGFVGDALTYRAWDCIIMGELEWVLRGIGNFNPRELDLKNTDFNLFPPHEYFDSNHHSDLESLGYLQSAWSLTKNLPILFNFDTWTAGQWLWLVMGADPLNKDNDYLITLCTDLRLRENIDIKGLDFFKRRCLTQELWLSNPQHTLDDKHSPAYFINWALSKKITIPWLDWVHKRDLLPQGIAGYTDNLIKPHIENQDHQALLDKITQLEVENERLKKDAQEPQVQTKGAYIAIIAGLLKKAYPDWQTKQKDRSLTSTVKRAIESAGLRCEDETIRKHLKEVFDKI